MLKQLSGVNSDGGSSVVFINPAQVVAVVPESSEQGKPKTRVYLTNGEHMKLVGTIREIAIILNGE